MKLSLEELESIVAAFQDSFHPDPEKEDADNYEAFYDALDDLANDLADSYDEIELRDRKGVWRFWSDDDLHVWLVRVDREPWYSEGMHIGIETGCTQRRSIERILQKTRDLPSTLVFNRVKWTLGSGFNFGEPEYTSKLGWVGLSSVPLDLDCRGWTCGFNGDHSIGRTFKTPTAAMTFLMSQAEKNNHCLHCGQSLCE